MMIQNALTLVEIGLVPPHNHQVKDDTLFDRLFDFEPWGSSYYSCFMIFAVLCPITALPFLSARVGVSL